LPAAGLSLSGIMVRDMARTATKTKDEPYRGLGRDFFQFLGELGLNNERPWFQDNKARYQQSVQAPAPTAGSAQIGRAHV
jgi:hypothetical protein